MDAASRAIDEVSKQKEIALSQQLHESVQGLLKMNQNTDSQRPVAAPQARHLLALRVQMLMLDLRLPRFQLMKFRPLESRFLQLMVSMIFNL
jgi:hypothetical protein